MKSICGYGRYNDAPEHVGCPRAKSDMTPCIARDGSLAVADDGFCVGCRAKATNLIEELLQALPGSNINQADLLKSMVLAVTELPSTGTTTKGD